MAFFDNASLSKNFTVVTHPLIAHFVPPPWYVQYIPEFILIAGIIATVLTFYFSPELRGAIKRLSLRFLGK